jgi:hypothetical protein
VFAPGGFIEPIESDVPGHHELGAVAEEESGRIDVLGVQPFDLAKEDARIDGDAVANDARFFRVEDAGGHEVQFELATLVHDRMAGVIPGAVASDHFCFAGQ